MRAKRILPILLSLVIVVVATAGLILYVTKTSTPKVSDFESCIAAGYPALGSSPRQCQTPNGKTYTEKVAQPTVKNNENKQAVSDKKTREYISKKGVTLRLNDWSEKMVLGSPVTVTGEVPGNWSFEASFPVLLKDADGNTIASQPAKLTGDWMTTAYVPFTVSLTYEVPTSSKTGTLVLQKDNPSSLPENDDLVEIPITYK